jgi:hypothetical protein
MNGYKMTKEMKTGACDLPNLENEESIKPPQELVLILRSGDTRELTAITDEKGGLCLRDGAA